MHAAQGLPHGQRPLQSTPDQGRGVDIDLALLGCYVYFGQLELGLSKLCPCRQGVTATRA